MNDKSLENGLVEHCAPTLAGLKSASLFRYFYHWKADALREIEETNHLLNGRGVFVEVLQWNENAALIYTYRFSHVQKELENPGVMKLLMKYGYRSNDVESCIKHLKERLLAYTCFPHEIGIFLGYPPEDVTGFIENRGQNCKCCGLWKVYCNEKEKTQLFDKLKKCSEVYRQVFAEGKNLVQMTVCA
ncbi:MAG: DUF3793 family protein [Coprococcus sp.]